MGRFTKYTYREWGSRLAERLASLVDDDGVLYDPVDGAPTPDDHYAVTHFALAAAKLAEASGTEVNSKALLALERYLSLPAEKLGHFEFNNQALLEISLSPVYGALPPALRSGIERYLSGMRWQSGPGRNVSNNWLALRAACHGLNWRRTGDPDELELARRFARYVVDKFRLNDGFFVDYSYRRLGTGYAVPLTYHAATCLGLALYLEATADDWVVEPLITALLALCPFVSSAGDGFVYGRTNACLISYCYALRPLTIVLDSAAVDGEPEAKLRRLLGRLLTGLRGLKNDDGSFDLNRHPAQGGRPAWDSYMHKTVYNAAAAAIFLASPPVEPAKPVADPAKPVADPAEPVANPVEPVAGPGEPIVESGVTYASDAGLIAVETDDAYAVFSARGAFVPGQADLFYGCRYAGCQPLLIRYRDEVIVPPPPGLAGSSPGPAGSSPGPAGSSPDPGVCGFVPAVEVNGVTYAPWVYDEVSVFESDGGTVIDGYARLFRVEDVCWRERSTLYKTAFRLYRRLTRDTYRPVSLRPLSGARLRRVIVYHEDAAALVLITNYNRLPPGTKVLPGGVRTVDGSDGFYKVVLPKNSGEVVSTEVTTSYGPAVLRRTLLNNCENLIIEVLGLTSAAVDVSYENGGLTIVKDGNMYKVSTGLD